jgi:hypothetical protein
LLASELQNLFGEGAILEKDSRPLFLFFVEPYELGKQVQAVLIPESAAHFVSGFLTILYWQRPFFLAKAKEVPLPERRAIPVIHPVVLGSLQTDLQKDE